MVKEQKCSPDKAAKYAGRLAFTCTVAAGRQGRAFVKLFYAQANAPLRGFHMSPTLVQCCLVVDQVPGAQADGPFGGGPYHTRNNMGLDSGEIPCLGVVVYARGSWYYTYLDAPPDILDQLLHRHSQINFLEMLAVLLFVTTFQDIIYNTAAFVFIDNNGVLGSLLKRSSSAPETNMIIGKIWLHAAEWSWAPVWARVESAANIADGPSRRDFTHVESLGAVLVAPVLHQWISTLWILDCGDCS